MTAEKQTGVEAQVEIRNATAAIDQRKATLKSQKLFRQLREEAVAKPRKRSAKKKKAKKAGRRIESLGVKSTDALTPQRRAKGSGWAGRRQK